MGGRAGADHRTVSSPPQQSFAAYVSSGGSRSLPAFPVRRASQNRQEQPIVLDVETEIDVGSWRRRTQF